MRKILYILLLNCLLYSNNNYLWPTDNKDVLTTNFCEPRHRRFHAGVDFRTYGEIGGNLYAIDSGQVIRLKIEPFKYGKAIYVQLDDGNIILYSHLDEFNPVIEKLSDDLRAQYNSSFYDHYLTENQKINVMRGDVIGYAGDTGSLSGPHLHFEIRDSENNPINPLIDYYKIKDNTNPYAKRIAFIPLDKNSWINGVQDYQLFDLVKINDYKYIIDDTISTVGDFGIAVETFDKINNSPFKFGVYKIELYIDDILKYSILFDEYSFKEDKLIYSEIDYFLLKTEGTFHRLFNNSKNFPFIRTNSEKYNIDKNFHNFAINISDANSNKIQIQGVLSGDAIFTPEFSYHINQNNKIVIEGDRDELEKSTFNLISKYDNIKKSQLIDTLIISKQKISDTYNILSYNYSNNSLNASTGYMKLEEIDPYQINGKFNFKFIENNFIIEFHEKILTGLEPKISINDSIEVTSYRKEKMIIASGFIDSEYLQNISKINIIYETEPEIIFEKKINILNKKNDYSYNNISLKNNNSFPNMFLIEDNKILKYENFNVVQNAFKIEPVNISYLEPVDMYISNDCQNCAIYKYNHEDEKWIYQKTEFQKNVLKTKLFTGGIFAVLQESSSPYLTNIIPSVNGIYKYKDLKYLQFVAQDNLSNIDPYSIEIYLNNEKLFYDFIPFRNLVRANISNYLQIGENTLNITIKDNLGNMKNINGDFTIIE